MTEAPRTAPEMDSRVCADCDEIGDVIAKNVDGSRGVDPRWLARYVASQLGARGWIRKRRAQVEDDEYDPQAALERNPAVYVERANVTGGEPEGQGGAS